MKFWSMTLHCSDVGKPAEPKPQQFKCDIFFSLEMLEIYMAIYFFLNCFLSLEREERLLSFIVAQRESYQLWEEITLQSKSLQVFMKDTERCTETTPCLPSVGLRRMNSGALEESETAWEGGGKQGCSHSNTLNSVCLWTLKTLWKLKYW